MTLRLRLRDLAADALPVALALAVRRVEPASAPRYAAAAAVSLSPVYLTSIHSGPRS